MPKVSATVIEAWKDESKFRFNLSISYLSKKGFYIILPDEFSHAFSLLSEKELEGYHLQEFKEGKYGNGRRVGNIVFAPTEAQLKPRAKKAIEMLMTKAVAERPVIIVSIEEHGQPAEPSSGGQSFNAVGIQMEVNYAVEHRLGDETRYLQTWRDEDADPDADPRRDEIRVRNNYKDHMIVIPDTPENREAVMRIYSALFQVHSKLAAMANSPDTFADSLLALSTNNKLLF